jgi:hypothetical protein
MSVLARRLLGVQATNRREKARIKRAFSHLLMA